MAKMEIAIQGVRGIPASHGGFETFAENLAVYLIGQGWKVTVYCQDLSDEHGEARESYWRGVRRIHIPVIGQGALSTIWFDYFSIKHACKHARLVLTLGYNTALFNVFLRINGVPNIINMDGIEWKRDKWKWYERAWLYLNERLGCLAGKHLVADHPEIAAHLGTRVNQKKITMIPYGARSVVSADESRLEKYGLLRGEYATLIARPEPENNVLEIVRAFSRTARGKKLVVLGKYEKENAYHRAVKDAASNEVVFLGAIYEHSDLDSLRYYSLIYTHGHTVGGTNPSLVEALGAGQPVLAHDNKYNRWVAGDGAVYFSDENECALQFDRLLTDVKGLESMSRLARLRFDAEFSWGRILKQYESLLKMHLRGDRD